MEQTVDNSSERDCVIFLPGIGGDFVDQSLDGLAGRIARAMDINAKDDAAEFFRKVKAIEDLGEHRGEVATIYRKDESGDRAILDVYKLDYHDTLVGRYESRNLLMKVFLLIFALPGSFLRVLRAMVFGAKSKTRIEKIQLLYALGVLSLLVVYVAILLGAVWAVVQDSAAVAAKVGTVSTEIFASWKWTSEWFARFPAVETSKGFFAWLAQSIVVLWAVVSLFLPPKFNVKDLISKAAVDYLCLIYYLNLGEQQSTIIGKLEHLIDEILRKSQKERNKNEGNHYRRIHLLTYSFGSIVALDALFPRGKKPSRVFESVHTLVTIGCPFDFVRALWLDYFDARRQYAANRPARWLNVYSPIDALGSNFRNDSKDAEANVNIRAKKDASMPGATLPVNIKFEEGLSFSRLSWTSSLTLIGLRAHSTYWGKKPEAEVNCFSDLVVALYEKEPALD